MVDLDPPREVLSDSCVHVHCTQAMRNNIAEEGAWLFTSWPDYVLTNAGKCKEVTDGAR